MENKQSKLQEIKVELDNANARLCNLSNEFYQQTSNLCGEFDRKLVESPYEECRDFYVDILQCQITFYNTTVNDIENTLAHLKSITNK